MSAPNYQLYFGKTEQVRMWKVCAPYKVSWMLRANGELCLVRNDTEDQIPLGINSPIETIYPTPSNDLLIIGGSDGRLTFLPATHVIAGVFGARTEETAIRATASGPILPIAGYAVVAHDSAITAISVNANETHLMTGDANGNVKVRELIGATRVWIIGNFESPIVSLACDAEATRFYIMTRECSYIVGDSGIAMPLSISAGIALHVIGETLLIGSARGFTICNLAGDVIDSHPAIRRTLRTFTTFGPIVFAIYSDNALDVINLDTRESKRMAHVDANVNTICAFSIAPQ